MKKIDVFFGLVLLAAFSFYMEGWTCSQYEQVQLGFLVLSGLIGSFIIIRHPKSIKRTLLVIIGLWIGNWGIFLNLVYATYWTIFGFV